MYMSALERYETLVAARDVTKSYGDIRALDGVSLIAEQGHITGLIGPDGAGKSTLMKIILSLEKKDGGTVSCLGVDPGYERKAIRNSIGYMPEVFSLYADQSVEENLMFYYRIHNGKKNEYANRRDRLYRFSRLENFAGTRAGNLSGGMKQKLALSCALMHDPRLLVLDEPTTGVDPLSRREFWNMLKELKDQGISILVSTPYMDEAMLCDRVYLMNRGRVLESGDPRNMLKGAKGCLFELSLKGKRPQEYIRETEKLFEGNPVYLSGRNLHIYLDREISERSFRGKCRPLDGNPECRKVKGTLEDLFMVRLKKEVTDDPDRQSGQEIR